MSTPQLSLNFDGQQYPRAAAQCKADTLRNRRQSEEGAAPASTETARLLARRSDPHTSHAAAARVAEFASQHAARIVLALKDRGPSTISEIAAATGINSVACARRLPELERLGAVRPQRVDGVVVTRAGDSGRMQRVWECAA